MLVKVVKVQKNLLKHSRILKSDQKRILQVQQANRFTSWIHVCESQFVEIVTRKRGKQEKQIRRGNLVSCEKILVFEISPRLKSKDCPLRDKVSSLRRLSIKNVLENLNFLFHKDKHLSTKSKRRKKSFLIRSRLECRPASSKCPSHVFPFFLPFTLSSR